MCGHRAPRCVAKFENDLGPPDGKETQVGFCTTSSTHERHDSPMSVAGSSTTVYSTRLPSRPRAWIPADLLLAAESVVALPSELRREARERKYRQQLERARGGFGSGHDTGSGSTGGSPNHGSPTTHASPPRASRVRQQGIVEKQRPVTDHGEPAGNSHGELELPEARGLPSPDEARRASVRAYAHGVGACAGDSEPFHDEPARASCRYSSRGACGGGGGGGGGGGATTRRSFAYISRYSDRPPLERTVETLVPGLKCREEVDLRSKLVARLPAGTVLRVLDSHVLYGGAQRVLVCAEPSGERLGWLTARKSRLAEPWIRELQPQPHQPRRAAAPRSDHSEASTARYAGYTTGGYTGRGGESCRSFFSSPQRSSAPGSGDTGASTPPLDSTLGCSTPLRPQRRSTPLRERTPGGWMPTSSSREASPVTEVGAGGGDGVMIHDGEGRGDVGGGTGASISGKIRRAASPPGSTSPPLSYRLGGPDGRLVSPPLSHRGLPPDERRLPPSTEEELVDHIRWPRPLGDVQPRRNNSPPGRGPHWPIHLMRWPVEVRANVPSVFFTSSSSVGGSAGPINMGRSVELAWGEVEAVEPGRQQRQPRRQARKGSKSGGKSAAAMARQRLAETQERQSQSSGAGRSKRNSGKLHDTESLIRSEELTATARELLVRAREMDAGIRSRQAIDVQLGSALIARKGSSSSATGKAFIEELLREWDPNRDGVISRMEFRNNVKALLSGDPGAGYSAGSPSFKRKPPTPGGSFNDNNKAAHANDDDDDTPAHKSAPPLDVKEIDALFADLDEDRSGALDVNEIRHALRRLQEKGARWAQQTRLIRNQSDAWRRLADEATAVAEVTARAEAAVKEYRTTQSEGALGATLGTILRKKGIKVSEIVSKWGGKDGAVDKSEFARECQALGLVSTREETDTLFDRLDDDGGGTLDAGEIRSVTIVIPTRIRSHSYVISNSNP